ncbi:MAG: hypothetical protein ACKV0T_00690 [Planctomycetales bacterium]
MKQREKLLLAGLVLALVLWKAPALLQGTLQPLSQRQNAKAQLETNIEKKKREKYLLDLAEKRFRELGQRSLPPDPTIALPIYHNWLIEKAEESKLSQVVVEMPLAGSLPKKGDTFVRISATIKGTGTLEHVCDFLHAFHQSGLLHRIDQLRLESPRHEGNPTLKVELRVEALALANSPPRKSLLVDGAPPLAPERPLKDRRAYDPIVAKNLFVRGYNGPPKPKVEEKRPTTLPPLPDTAEFVNLVWSVARDDRRDAQLYDRANNKYTKLVPGGEFQVAGLSGRVILISDVYVVLEIEGEQWRLDLGTSLKEMRKLPKKDA